MLQLIFYGIPIGFVVAAPLGAVGVLCIQKTLHQGRLAGFLTGLGAAMADALFAAIAGLGLTMIADFLVREQIAIRLIGSLILLYVGVKILRTPAEHLREKANNRTLLQSISTAFILTSTNPMTFMAFTLIFATLGIIQEHFTWWMGGILIGAIFIGSTLWWLMLSTLTQLVRRRLREHWLHNLNRGAAIIILGLAISILVSLLPNVF